MSHALQSGLIITDVCTQRRDLDFVLLYFPDYNSRCFGIRFNPLGFFLLSSSDFNLAQSNTSTDDGFRTREMCITVI
jgi:hypothetical protein